MGVDRVNLMCPSICVVILYHHNIKKSIAFYNIFNVFEIILRDFLLTYNAKYVMLLRGDLIRCLFVLLPVLFNLA